MEGGMDHIATKLRKVVKLDQMYPSTFRCLTECRRRYLRSNVIIDMLLTQPRSSLQHLTSSSTHRSSNHDGRARPRLGPIQQVHQAVPTPPWCLQPYIIARPSCRSPNSAPSSLQSRHLNKSHKSQRQSGYYKHTTSTTHSPPRCLRERLTLHQILLEVR